MDNMSAFDFTSEAKRSEYPLVAGGSIGHTSRPTVVSILEFHSKYEID